jgi:hypothetical protein
MDNILRFPATNPPRLEQLSAKGISPATRDNENTSQIIEAAVAYCCSKGTYEFGFIADHTGNCVFASHEGVVGKRHQDAAYRSICKLTKLMDRPRGLMTVEVISLASVANFVLKQTENPDIDFEFADEELQFLKSFARLVEQLCKDQYHRDLARMPGS